MKKINLLFLAILAMSMGMMGQRSAITLTFTAGYNSTVTYLQPDSIRITNISKGMDTVLYYPDTILVLEYPVGIPGNNKQEEDFTVNQNFPNPVNDQTLINIYVPAKDKVEINIFDVSGRSLLRSDWQFDRGYHSLNFIPGERGMLFLTVSCKGISNTIKILSWVAVKRENSLTYAGYRRKGFNLKSNESSQGFVFNPGDSLLYIGYAATGEGINGSDVLGDRPQSNETYLFEILEGIPCPGIPAVNYGGQTYSTVQIGNQCWFKENLNSGTMIDSLSEQINNGIIEKYCKNDDPDYCSLYGGLYQWAEVVQYLNGATNTTSWYPVPTGNVRGICPPGWHIPSDQEWCTLEIYIDPSVTCSFGQNGTDAGGKMKETGTLDWDPPNMGATNESGFSALSSSYRYSDYTFRLDKNRSNWWSSTEYSSSQAWDRTAYFDIMTVGHWGNIKTGGMPARCIKD